MALGAVCVCVCVTCYIMLRGGGIRPLQSGASVVSAPCVTPHLSDLLGRPFGKPMAVSRAGNRALWLAVAYVAHDCVCSVIVANLAGSRNSNGGGGGGGALGGSSAAALFVDKASLRFFRFTRGELVIMR